MRARRNLTAVSAVIAPTLAAQQGGSKGIGQVGTAGARRARDQPRVCHRRVVGDCRSRGEPGVGGRTKNRNGLFLAD
jgi:hypothetical protein